jgi:hypothetical protein
MVTDMRVKASQLLERTANVAIIVMCIAACTAFIERYYLQKNGAFQPLTPQVGLQVGSTFPSLPDTSYGAYSATVAILTADVPPHG